MPIAEYITTITKTDGAHRVGIERPGSGFDLLEFPAFLGPDSLLTVSGTDLTLETLWNKLIGFEQDDLDTLFNERGQRDIGSYLFTQLFGGLRPGELTRLRQDTVDLRIITDDSDDGERIGRLPWTMMFDERRFLAATGWMISISKQAENYQNILLPPSPKILVVMPEPRHPDLAPTNSKKHFSALQNTLSKVNPLHTLGDKLFRVTTWQDFQEKVPEICPDILYYYGHGYSDTTNSELIFVDRNTKEPEYIAASTIANLLASLGSKAPYLAYFNCCLGDVGGVLGVGKQLNRDVPAVITNCTMAEADAAQEQAIEIFRNLLLRGLAPHEAVAALRQHLGMQAGSLGDVRWLTPVVHRGYSAWAFTPPETSNAKLPPGWEHTLNRVTPTAVAKEHTRRIINGRIKNTRTLVLLWYGKKNQGIAPFYDRLESELRTDFEQDIGILKKLPELPVDSYGEEDLDDPIEFDRSIREMMAQAFEAHDYNEIGDQVRSEIQRTGKRRAIVYVRFPVIERGKDFYSTVRIKNFLDWLEKRFAERFEEHIFVVIGLGYEVSDPRAFRDALEQRFENTQYNALAFQTLDELGAVGQADLRDFFSMYEDCIYLPGNLRRQTIDLIMERSGGEYERTVEELRKVVSGNIRIGRSRENLIVDGDY